MSLNSGCECCCRTMTVDEWIREFDREIRILQKGQKQIIVGTTTTGDPGTPAMVTEVETETTITLNFTIPKGDTGAQGPVGPQGPPGKCCCFVGCWVKDVEYIENNIVICVDTVYKCIQANTNHHPKECDCEGGTCKYWESTGPFFVDGGVIKES